MFVYVFCCRIDNTGASWRVIMWLKMCKKDKNVVYLSNPFFEFTFFTQTLLTQSCGGPRFGTAFRARFRHHTFHFFSHAARQIFPVKDFLYSTCTQTWKQKLGIWRFITTITELTICFSSSRKLQINKTWCSNWLHIPLNIMVEYCF